MTAFGIIITRTTNTWLWLFIIILGLLYYFMWVCVIVIYSSLGAKVGEDSKRQLKKWKLSLQCLMCWNKEPSWRHNFYNDLMMVPNW